MLLQALGLGDILLFMALTTTFSPIAFVILFIAALIFSLVLHLVLSKYKTNTTVPLAGYMSIFFAATYIAQWLKLSNNLYML